MIVLVVVLVTEGTVTVVERVAVKLSEERVGEVVTKSMAKTVAVLNILVREI